jgi:hypothetical protein
LAAIFVALCTRDKICVLRVKDSHEAHECSFAKIGDIASIILTFVAETSDGGRGGDELTSASPKRIMKKGHELSA